MNLRRLLYSKTTPIFLKELSKTQKEGYYGILYISPELINTPNAVYIISKKQPPIGLLQHIENSLKKEIERQKLLAYKIENLDDIMKNVETNVSVQTKKLDEFGVEKGTSTGIAMALARIYFWCPGNERRY